MTRGRRPKPAADKLGVRVQVYLTAAELDRLDAARGESSRSEWLAAALRPKAQEPR